MSLECMEFWRGLGINLGPGHIHTLMVCQQLEGQDVYLEDVAAAVGASHISTRRYMRGLQRFGHLIYCVHNRGTTEPNYQILWARRSLKEKAPDRTYTVRKARTIKLVHPEHGLHEVTSGNFRRFVREWGLSYRSFRNVIAGTQGHHRGWRLCE